MTPQELALVTVVINKINRKAIREMREFHQAVHGQHWNHEWSERGFYDAPVDWYLGAAPPDA